MKILIADDDIITLTLITESLRAWGYEPLCAKDGADAWLIFERERPRIVISDWMMPEMDGLELTRRIRARATDEYAYIMLLTVRTQIGDIVQGLEAGADDYLAKPFDRDELRWRLRAGQRVIEMEETVTQHHRQLIDAHEALTRDLHAAARLQQSLLPRHPPPCDGFRFGWRLRPCEALAGDTLNIMNLDEDHVGIHIVDVCGHGVTPSLFAVSLHHLMSPDMQRSPLLKKPIGPPPHYILSPPAEVAQRLNEMFLGEMRCDLYFALFYGLLNRRTLEFTYTVCGLPPLRLMRRGEITRKLDGRGLPIGLIPEASYRQHTIQLLPGDRIFMHSDGIDEIINARDEFMDAQAIQQLLDMSRGASLDESLDGVLAAIDGWRGETPLRDDLSMILIETPDAS